MAPLDFSALQGLDAAADFAQETTVTDAAGKLQREADQNADARARAAAVYQEHQDNIKLTYQLTTEIAKGIRAGADIYTLFLKAMDAIGRMTGDRQLLDRTRADLIAIYGVGLREPAPLELEISAAESRLARLRQAAATAGDDYAQNINAAIRSHEALIEQLRG